MVTQKTRDPTEERNEEDLLSVMHWNQRRKYNQRKVFGSSVNGIYTIIVMKTLFFGFPLLESTYVRRGQGRPYNPFVHLSPFFPTPFKLYLGLYWATQTQMKMKM